MKYYSNLLKLFLFGFLLWATYLFVYAIYSEPVVGEAYTGSFDVIDLSEGWTMISPDGEITENVSFPLKNGAEKDMTVTFEKTLPDNVRSGMRLCVRVVLSDIKVAINGKLRSDYEKRNFWTKRVPMSTSVILNLRDEDPGALWLKNRILSYAASPEFEPAQSLTDSQFDRLCGITEYDSGSNQNEAKNPNDVTM